MQGFRPAPDRPRFGAPNTGPAPIQLPSVGDVKAQGGRAVESERQVLRSPFIDLFPQLRSYRAYFHKINCGSLALAATGGAWYCLRKLAASRIGEFSYVGADVRLLSADVDGVGSAPDSTAWGNAAGYAAYLVLVANANLPLRTWTSAPAYLPGLNSGTDQLINPDAPAEYLEDWAFPAGKFTNSPPGVLVAQPRYLPGVFRFTGADVLDVAVVVNPAQVNGLAANRLIAGIGKVTVYTMPVTGDRTWQQS